MEKKRWGWPRNDESFQAYTTKANTAEVVESIQSRGETGVRVIKGAWRFGKIPRPHLSRRFWGARTIVARKPAGKNSPVISLEKARRK